MRLTSLDSLVSWELIYVSFKTIKLEKHELNHFKEQNINVKSILVTHQQA